MEEYIWFDMLAFIYTGCNSRYNGFSWKLDMFERLETSNGRNKIKTGNSAVAVY